MDSIGAALVVGVVLALYFLPAMVASAREHQNAGAIFALNLLLGWIVIGWIVALIWALTEVRRSAPPPT